tara:strand:- start:4574 stop:4978 length:405 start_codon:yes stop_codon:yes gene_type:complete
MYKYLFSFLFLLNFNYLQASFPVSNQLQQDTIEKNIDEIEINIVPTNNTEFTYKNAIISFFLAPIGFLFLILAIGNAFVSNDSGVIVFALLSLTSYIGAVILGLRSIIRKEKGFILALLGVILGFLGIITMIGV